MSKRKSASKSGNASAPPSNVSSYDVMVSDGLTPAQIASERELTRRASENRSEIPPSNIWTSKIGVNSKQTTAF